MSSLLIEEGRRSANYEKITVADTAIGFTAAEIKGNGTAWTPNRGCREVFCTLEITSGGIRFKVDGGDPTATDGHLLGNGDTLTIKNPWDIYNFKAIRTTAESGTLHVTYKF